MMKLPETIAQMEIVAFIDLSHTDDIFIHKILSEIILFREMDETN